MNTGGNNSISIGKANLPNIKLKMDQVTATIPAHTHAVKWKGGGTVYNWDQLYDPFFQRGAYSIADMKPFDTQTGGAGNTGSISPYTETLGNGSPINIQPSYITLKFWKRLS